MPKHDCRPSPLPCWPALTLHLTFRALARLRHYDAAFCFEESRKKSTLTQHNEVHHRNTTYLTFFFSKAVS